MKPQEEIKKEDRGFHWYDKAWYKMPDQAPHITFGIYPDDGDQGTRGEMVMEWINLGGYVPQLQCFNDAFAVLATFTDLITELREHDSENFSQEEFVQILLKCGFRDLTPYSRP